MTGSSRGRRFFESKSIVVTGGSRGIGLATAELAFQLGAHVCIVARDPTILAQAAASIERARAHGGQLLDTIACDCTDRLAVQPLFDEFITRRGIPHCLVNCVGYARPGYVQDFDLDDFRRHMDVNYYGQLVPLLILLPHLLRAGRGHITNVSSLLGFMGVMGYTAYCPTKFALAGLTDALRNELRPRGITFSIVYPPDVDTPGYVEENRHKPPECLEISKRARLMSAHAVARSIIDGIVHNRFEVLPGESAYVRRLHRYVPWLVRRVLDHDYLKAMNRTARHHVQASD